MPRLAGWEVGRVPGFYKGAGVPSASTLEAGDYILGEYYVNTSATTLYICSTAGSASTSVWTQIGATTTVPPAITVKAGSGSGVDYTNATTAYADVDTANLSFTVTVLSTQKATITFEGICYQSTAVNSIGLVIADTTTILKERIIDPATFGAGIVFMLSHVFVGDNASHTFRPRFKTFNAADAANINNFNAARTAIMTVRLETAT